MKPGSKLKNGAVVLLMYANPEETIVLAYWVGNNMPYVTWRVDEDGYSFWGHYYKEYDEAKAGFDKRIK